MCKRNAFFPGPDIYLVCGSSQKRYGVITAVKVLYLSDLADFHIKGTQTKKQKDVFSNCQDCLSAGFITG